VQLPAAVNVRTAVDELTSQPVVPMLVTEYVMLGDPRPVARAEGVAGDAAVVSDVVGDHVTACIARLVVKLMLEDVADAWVASAAIVAVNVQVPAETNATIPVEEPTVQTPAVELV
jgi:hypothetical protein